MSNRRLIAIVVAGLAAVLTGAAGVLARGTDRPSSAPSSSDALVTGPVAGPGSHPPGVRHSPPAPRRKRVPRASLSQVGADIAPSFAVFRRSERASDVLAGAPAGRVTRRVQMPSGREAVLFYTSEKQLCV